MGEQGPAPPRACGDGVEHVPRFGLRRSVWWSGKAALSRGGCHAARNTPSPRGESCCCVRRGPPTCRVHVTSAAGCSGLTATAAAPLFPSPPSSLLSHRCTIVCVLMTLRASRLMELANFTTVRATACLWAGHDCARSHSPTGGSPTQAGCSHICVKGAGRSPTERARLRLTHEDGARSGSPSLAGDRSLARTRNEAAPDREATASSVHTNPVLPCPTVPVILSGVVSPGGAGCWCCMHTLFRKCCIE